MPEGPPTHDGCYVLTLRDTRVLAGLVRVTPAGSGVVAQLELQTYAVMGGQRPYLAILSPESVVSHITCTLEEAQALAAALNHRHGNVAPPARAPRSQQASGSFAE